MGSKKIPNWTEPELSLLHQLAEQYPFPKIAMRLHRLQKRNGIPIRSIDAISTKLKRLGYSKKPTLDNFNRDYLACALGISRDRARTWSKTFALPNDRQGHFMVIGIEPFRQWVYTHADCVAGIDADRLDWFMNDRDFCEMVEQRQRPRIGRAQPVIRRSDGQIFPSLKAAARASYVHPVTVRAAIDRGKDWAYLNQEQAIAPAKYSKSV